MKKGCYNCKANDRMLGICLILCCPTLAKEETADNFECEYWEHEEHKEEQNDI